MSSKAIRRKYTFKLVKLLIKSLNYKSKSKSSIIVLNISFKPLKIYFYNLSLQ